MRHALSVRKWFKKQLRTGVDAYLDETEPNQQDPPPIDNDDESVALPTDRSHRSIPPPGGNRPLKGGYWFIPEKFGTEVPAGGL